MNTHESDEVLSALLDEELGAGEQARVQAHLAGCRQCSLRREGLQRAILAVGALGETAPTAEESRAIRRAVLDSRGRPRSWRYLAAFAGATAVVAAVSVVASFFQGPGTPQTTEESALSGGVEEFDELEFADQSEVRAAVAALPEVQEGRGRYVVSDVGGQQSEAISAYGGYEEPRVVGAQGQSGEESQAGPTAGDSATKDSATGESLEDCLRTIIRSQPYPMMPIAARSALFKETPAWLLVFSWTRSTGADARLDRIQIWLFDRRVACSAENFLYYFAS